jgi:hypothetical protein
VNQKRKLAEIPNEKQSLDLYINGINDLYEDLESDYQVVNEPFDPMISGNLE